VFSSTIQELGTISTTHTKVITKKKDSYHQLKDNNKVPRSLCLKCTLTTAPIYAENSDFLRIKEELDSKIATFIKEGSQLMTEWAAINIKLLITDRCHSILQKTLTILDGLIAYTVEVIDSPEWPSVANKNPILLLLKLYFSNKLFNIDDLVEYFELSPENMLAIVIKTIYKSSSNKETSALINSLNLADIDLTNELHNIFVKETLIDFDQIL
jgi:hypothetical protein